MPNEWEIETNLVNGGQMQMMITGTSESHPGLTH